MAHALETNVRKHCSLGHLNHQRHEINDSIIHMSYHIYIYTYHAISAIRNIWIILVFCHVWMLRFAGWKLWSQHWRTGNERYLEIRWRWMEMDGDGWDTVKQILNENLADMYVRMWIAKCQLPSIESIYLLDQARSGDGDLLGLGGVSSSQSCWAEGNMTPGRWRWADNWYGMIRYDKIWFETRCQVNSWTFSFKQFVADFGLSVPFFF